MSIPKEPSKAKLVTSFISCDEALINSSIKALAKKNSPPDFVSGFVDFGHTTYYEDEMGTGILICRLFFLIVSYHFKGDLHDKIQIGGGS